jgi:hypothetical protein
MGHGRGKQRIRVAMVIIVMAGSLVGVTTTGALASTTGGTLTGGSVSLKFGNPGGNVEFVNKLVWTDSSGIKSPNLAASGGTTSCGDPLEFFGQSYGAPEGTGPIPVIDGTRGTWALKAPTKASIKDSVSACGNSSTTPVHTTYTVYPKADVRHNEVEISRSFGFTPATPVFTTTGVRPYVPRLPIASYPNVIFPNAAGTALNTVDATTCANDCFQSDWNGTWFADDNGSGRGMIVVRAAAMTSPVDLTVNNDTLSASNLSSFVLVQPAGGWTAPITEVEFLCFYDTISWPPAQRNQLQLPSGCGG